jgi:hypothetical protein
MRATGWRRLPLGVFVFAAAHSTTAATPAVIGDAKDYRCRDALQMATAAFHSTSPSLLWPISTPSSSKVILRQDMKDISGGYALWADPAEFVVFGRSTAFAPSVTILWSRHTSAGKRLALVDEPFGWRGDIYSVYLVSPETTPERFKQQAEAQLARGEFLDGVLGDPRWIPPIILMDVRSRDYWILDRGYPWEAMADWHVYGVSSGGLKAPCRISFGFTARDRHDRADRALKTMPAAVRTLASLLDEALGPGTNEGTLQPTKRVRLTVAKGWANAALRPWALTDTPYNRRAEVEQGLAEWAKGNRQRTSLLKRIHSVYPTAERALAGHYAGHFKDAPRLAQHVLDYMFRIYFVFPADGPPDPDEMVRPT